MTSSIGKGANSSGLRARRPSQEQYEDTIEGSASPARNSTTSITDFAIPIIPGRRSIAATEAPHAGSTTSTSGADSKGEMTSWKMHSDTDTPSDDAKASAPPLSFDHIGLAESSSLESRRTTVSFSTTPVTREDNSPPPTSKQPTRPQRPTISHTSPGTNDREYSLRRVLLTKNLTESPGGYDDIELAEAGPSKKSLDAPQRDISKERNGKKSRSTVRISPVVEYELSRTPDSAKRMSGTSGASGASGTSGTMSLPRYNVWSKQQLRSQGHISKMKSMFHTLQKRILRIQEIPPSKDGRHLDLDPFRKGSLLDERTNTSYISNAIRSSRYTVWNFLPKQLLFQFAKLANFYFLIISIMQMIPGLSTTGNYTTFVPLMVFVSISMAKEGYDDFRRSKLDKAENNKVAVVLHAYQPDHIVHDEESAISTTTNPRVVWEEKKWENVRVGDIVRLERNDSVPADMVLLHSNGLNGIAYIETMALDGETNLKAKQASPLLAKRCQILESLAKCNAHFVVEDPNVDLYNFEGRVTVDGETLPLTANEIIYRGTVLRNTSEAIGMVINTGEECKIRMNANKNPRIKAPSLQFVVNRVVIVVVIFVLSLASFQTIAYQVWSRAFESHSWYLKGAHVPITPILTSFIIMFNTMIPLSLYVSMEIIKLGQLYLMHDIDMYDPVTDTPMEAHTTTINEELGQVSYIFSDKTGTLTDNVMRFRKMSVAGTAWVHDFDLQKEAAEAVSAAKDHSMRQKGKARSKWNVKQKQLAHFSADYSMSKASSEPQGTVSRRSSVNSLWKSSARPAKAQPELRTEDLLQYLRHNPHSVFARKAKFFLLSIALCHTCLPEVQENGNIDFQAASPDELALVRAAQELGYVVIDRKALTLTLKIRVGPESPESSETYEVLDIIEFSSKRKRMSIVVRFPDGRICIFCKGADSIVMKRLKLSTLATQKVAQVQRRASVRKSIEAEQALRKMSIVSPRSSMELDNVPINKMSIGGLTRSGSTSHNMQPIRDELDSWLKDREVDVDLSSVDNQGAYPSPRTSFQRDLRRSLSMLERESSNEVDDEFYDDMVDETVAVNESKVFERTFQHIDDFATEGLRTLLYGYRFIDEVEYLDWKKKFQKASTSLINRQELVEEAAEMIEKDLDLAGATAIEDKLQKGVPETIDKLRRANIKLWMLTGDKRETAINIGHSCRLIKDYSNVVILNYEAGKVENVMATALLEIGGGGIPHSVVVVDGATLAYIESNETLTYLFFDLAVIADSVICCRASPSQKASLVKQIRNKVKKSVTLAIGDGANDIAMIQEAHVGIGITGKEGLQAARISDYSIAQFRFLQKLLLVHGRWNYIRTGKYILGTFWKEMLFYLTQALYQRWNGYTGTSLYESWSMSMFNTLFTSLPVILLGIFEQDLSATTLLAVPELYTQGQRDGAFNFRKYFWWMFMAAGEAMVVFFLMCGLYAEDASERYLSLFSMGDLAFSCIVIIINTKLLFIEMHYKTWISVLGWFISIAGWTLWNVALSGIYSNANSTVYAVRSGFLKHFGGSPKWWLVVIVIVDSVIVYEIGTLAMKKIFLPSDVDIWQVLEKDKVIKRRLGEAAFDDISIEVDSGTIHWKENPEAEDGHEERENLDLIDRRRVMTPLTTIPTAQPAEIEEYEMQCRRGSDKLVSPRKR